MDMIQQHGKLTLHRGSSNSCLKKVNKPPGEMKMFRNNMSKNGKVMAHILLNRSNGIGLNFKKSRATWLWGSIMKISEIYTVNRASHYLSFTWSF